MYELFTSYQTTRHDTKCLINGTKTVTDNCTARNQKCVTVSAVFKKQLKRC